MPRSIHGAPKYATITAPLARTTSTDNSNNTALNTVGFREMNLLVHVGTISDSVNLDIQIDESNSSSGTFAQIAAPTESDINPNAIQATNSDNGALLVAYYDLRKLEPFLKFRDVLSGNSGTYSIIAELFGADENPTSQTYETDV